MILHLYIARRFLMAFGIVTAVFVAILLPIDMADQLRGLNEGEGFTAVLQLALLNLPRSLMGLLPLFVMLATLLLFLGLARTSELVVVRAAGRSALAAAASPVVVALIIGGLALALLNPLVASTARQFELTRAQMTGGESRTVSLTQGGLWLRQGTGSEQTVIRARATNSDGTHLFDASFFTFDANGLLLERMDAREAVLERGAWDLADVRRWPIAGSDNAEADARTFAVLTLPSTLTAEQIRDSFGNPETVSIFDLPGFIRQLNDAGFAALQHRTWFQMQLSSPLVMAAMVLIGAGFTMRHTRFGKTGVMVLAAILLGFGVVFIRRFAEVLGETGQVSVTLVAWTPPIAAILLALGFLLHTEDG
ncbi:LPS export ABC transporter permease LptG [Rhodobacteraceae bacterium N5(2021)]|uniref:LPS export ABC transporter permease LptG n=2 Tax=Gymnodinialimonas phycosphaerae TaxID=2841589 RepID=A0A975TVC9_9RHOB|nr:LPS export ABC transporter permease LptG [Gymnodinialimonas phycosphaerae]MBY4891609.1 LPS export ABC transporter permease LptG [Gymnodinialimonas phycosphaerae]